LEACYQSGALLSSTNFGIHTAAGSQLLYSYCKLRIDQKLKNTPFLKELIQGASKDETNFRSNQVSTNQPLLHFNTSNLHLFWFFGGHTPLKKGCPTCMQVVQGQPAYACGLKTIWPHAYVIVSKTTCVHPQKGRKIKMQWLTSSMNLLVTGCMSTGERGSMRIYISWSMRTLQLWLN
jgi:hypothetical protein